MWQILFASVLYLVSLATLDFRFHHDYYYYYYCVTQISLLISFFSWRMIFFSSLEI